MAAGILVAILGCNLISRDNQNQYGVLVLVAGILAVLGGNSIVRRFSPIEAPKEFTEILDQSSSTEISLDARRTILQGHINRYLAQGFRVVSQTDTTAQLIKPKQFSCVIAALSLLLVGIGFLIYVFWYWASKDQTVYIQVDPFGRVIVK